MPSDRHRKLLEDDKKFLEWIKTVGRRKLSPDGPCILKLYVDGCKSGEWVNTVDAVCRERHQWWPFIRGALSGKEISTCVARYIDRFVFIVQNAPSEPYITSLLDMERAQTAFRMGSASTVPTCPNCVSRDRIIAGLRRQVESLTQDARPVADEESAKFEFMRSYFRSTYVRGDGTTSRMALRADMEEAIRQEYSPDDVLTCRSTLWNRFVTEVVRDARNDYRPFRVRKKKTE